MLILSKNTMSWIIVLLLVLIIILLSVCIYLDIEFTAAFTSSNLPDTTELSTTTKIPITSALPVSTTTPKVTTIQTPVTTKTPATTKLPITTTPVTTQAVITTAPVTTETPKTTAPPVTTKAPPAVNAPTICIDAGHGFTDPGACRVMNGQLYEEDAINLAIALKLKEELLALGYNVIMTHDGENLPEQKYLNDSSTPFDANGRNYFIRDHQDEIDLVISIHCNTASDTSVTGTRFYILSSKMTGYNYKSIALAESLCLSAYDAFGTTPPKNKYLTQELAVLKTGIPSVLVESAFMSNNSDLTKLIDPAWQALFAKALAEGVQDYLT